MEVHTLLATLEEILATSKTIPFTSGKVIVDKDQFENIIGEIIEKLAEELKQAKWIKEERQRILLEAQKEADGVVKEAESRIISMIDEHEITRKAYDQKNEIIETANEMSNIFLDAELRSMIKEYNALEESKKEQAREYIHFLYIKGRN